jgi:hypothetical protein
MSKTTSMTRTLTFEIPNEIYEILEQQAAREGRTTESVAIEWLHSVQPKPRPKLNEEERRAALEELMKFAGAANSGDPQSADNDRIDEDLAREYASSHEES